MEHPAPQDGGELYHQDAGHKIKAPSKGNLANLRYAKFISSRRRAPAARRFSAPVWILFLEMYEEDKVAFGII